jgi:alpha-methylacyl-CoA racemase
MSRAPLAGVRVLDFSTLLPGPLASLVLAEAGAEVIKVERPGGGDELRLYPPPFGGWGFALLNRGKKSIALDLKDPEERARLVPLLREAQIVIEQFRPGVMQRLGLGYEALKAINPALVYCSITGYGQSGPKAEKAGHDLNYQADSGLLSLSGDADGKPVLAPGLIADIGGGTLPALVNILLALRGAEATGEGCHLDISMSDNLLCWAWWALAGVAGGEGAPAGGGALLTGGSPRYQIYRTKDGRHLAVAALEDRFWRRFCDLMGLSPGASIREVLDSVSYKESKELSGLLEKEDCCCSLVSTLEEALADPHFQARGLFHAKLRAEGGETAALPVPLAPALKLAPDTKSAPDLGENDEEL